MRLALNLMRITFEWIFVIAILFGTIHEMYYQFVYYNVLAILPMAFPLLVLVVWIYTKIESYMQGRRINAPIVSCHKPFGLD